jgi:hypothetical protein
MKKRICALAVLMLALLLPACAQPGGDATQPSATTGEVGVRGPIEERTVTDDGLTLLIEGEKAADTMYDAAWVTVDKNTFIRTAAGVPSTVDALQTGVIVEVVFIGPVAESWPVQGRAGTVTILSQ